MRKIYKAKIINLNGITATYEYEDEGGFVQISSQLPQGVKAKLGDNVYITIDNGSVIQVNKTIPFFSTDFGMKFFGIATLILVIAIIWFALFVVKKIVIKSIWMIVVFAIIVYVVSSLKNKRL